MKLIPLTKGQFAEVSDRDYARLSRYSWQAYYSKTTGTFYARRDIRCEGRKYTLPMSRDILGLVKGDGIVADHRNGDTLDNQRCNLRRTDVTGNQRNQYRHRAGKLIGVRQRGRRFHAYTVKHGKQIHLGTFDTAEAAYAAYMKETR